MKSSQTMSMSDYLKAIADCPEEYVRFGDRVKHKLLTDFSIDDNFAVYVNLDYTNSVELISKLDNFELKKEVITRDKKHFYSFWYKPGTINGNIIEWIHFPPSFIDNILASRYKTTLMFHTYQGKFFPGKLAENISEERALASSLIVLSNELIKNNIDFCFSSPKKRDVKSLSELIHYP